MFDFGQPGTVARDYAAPYLHPRPNAMNTSAPSTPDSPIWHQDDGAPVSCHEKIKVMNENLAEIRQMAQDAFEDALPMGCSEAQVREVFVSVMRDLDNPWPVGGR
jgi:hypothetical protein